MPESMDSTPTTLPAHADEFTEVIERVKAPVKPRASRQGLPTEYRMRHDAHYVEELNTISRPIPAEHGAAAAPVPTSAALRDLCQEFEGLASCFNLIDQGPRPLRERLGLSLAKVGVQRSIRYAQNLRVLLEDLRPVYRDVRLDDLIRHGFSDFKDELRLTESTLVLELPNSPLVLQGDATLLRNALRAAASATVALVELSGAAASIQISAFASEDSILCEFRQDAYQVESQQLAKLFDLDTADRTLGRSNAVAVNAARRIAQLHGGQFHARRTSSGGCLFLFSLPRVVSSDMPVVTN